MKVYYDPLDPECKSVRGGAEEYYPVKISIFTDGAESCRLYLHADGENDCREIEMEKEKGGRFSAVLTLPVGLYFYAFAVDGTRYGCGDGVYAKEGENRDFQFTSYKKTSFPTRLCQGVTYQIFPDRFARAENSGDGAGKRVRGDWGGMPEYLPDANGKIKNDDFFGGNFKGITEKLGYLATLGVNTIYLNPISEANSNHRYDTGNYMKTDPLLGTEEDFRELIEAADKMGVKVIIDGVYNHTGDDSVYFDKYGKYESVGAYESESSPYFGWYSFRRYPDDYESWWDIDILPSVKKDCRQFQEFIAGDDGVLDKYFSLGAGGVRLDVADELSDEFIRAIRKKVKSYGEENAVIGEVWEDATNKIAYGQRRKYFQGEELDGVMNYPLKDAVISALLCRNPDILAVAAREQLDHYPKGALDCLMNILGTHDTPRILTVLGKCGVLKKTREEMATESLTPEERRDAIKKLRCAALLQYTLYGFPCVYYGDEIETEGNKDPFNRKCFDWDKTDCETAAFYRSLGEMRDGYTVFKGGETVDVKSENGVFSFARENADGRATVFVNLGDGKKSIEPEEELFELTRKRTLSKVVLNTYEFAVFYEKYVLRI